MAFTGGRARRGAVRVEAGGVTEHDAGDPEQAVVDVVAGIGVAPVGPERAVGSRVSANLEIVPVVFAPWRQGRSPYRLMPAT